MAKIKMTKEEKRAAKIRGRMRGPGKGGEPAKHPMKTLVRILKVSVLKQKALFAIVLLCLIIGAIVNVFASSYLKPLIDDYVVPLIGVENPDFSALGHSLTMVAFIYVAAIIASFLQSRLMINLAQNSLCGIREDLFSKLQRLPLKYFDTNTHGNIMSRFTNDTDTMRELISRTVLQLVSSAVTIVGVFSMMLYYSWIMTLIVVVTVIISMTIVGSIASKSGYYFSKQQKSVGALNGYIEETISGQKVVKVFNHEDDCIETFDRLNQDLRNNACSANGFANIMMPIMGNIGNILYVVLAFSGSAMALNNVPGITLGTIASFLLLSKSFTNTVNQVSQQFNSIVMALAGAERVFEVIDQLPEVDEGNVTLVRAKQEKDTLVEDENGDIWAWKIPNEDSIVLVPLKGDVRFNNVDFSYNESKQILTDINVFAKPGQKIAFIGETGAGKTTITNLINRFYDVNDGEIIYDGINVKDIKKDDLRHSLGIVLQDTNLFTGTIADNIRFGKLDATFEEVKEAAKLANADYFISLLPDGYDTVIEGNGGNLSQGQRQLLAIARAAIANPPVLILDEATSSIDTRTERIIGKGIDKLMDGRTVFVIAHRLSTVRDSEAIIVLDHGKIIERGDHNTLIAQKGQYYRFYTGAFELE